MRVYIETLGCPKNQIDTENAIGILESAGHTIVAHPEEADAIVVNTCAFINDAKQESVETILAMSEYKNAGDKMLVVSGCLGQRFNDQLFKEIPEADIIVGVNDYEQLPKMLDEYKEKQVRTKARTVVEAKFEESSHRKSNAGNHRALLRISEGCDNHCTYCVIPSIRGPFRSRTKENILAEAKTLAADGCKELVIVAQDVTNYGMDLYGRLCLPELLREISKIEGIAWIRLMYCYVDKITDELIQEIANNMKICKYIDIPLQHCSDKVLKIMARKGSKSDIINTVKKLREAVYDIHIRTTFITGFPGEDKEAFDELVAFTEEMKFDRLGVFAYSKEEGTPAAKIKNQVRQDVKEKRKEQIMESQRRISLEKNQQKIGKEMMVLVEEKLEGENTYLARTQHDAYEIDNAVIINTSKELSMGGFVRVKIVDGFDYDIVGELV